MPSQYRQSTLASELCQITATSDSRRAMQQLAQDLLDEAEIVTPPVNLRLIASFQKVRDIQKVVMPHAGRLVPDGTNYLIQVNARHSNGKQRFTTGHEIGHTFIPSFQRQPYIIQDMVTGLFQDEHEEEHLCDIAAAELLLPESLFRPQATRLGCHLNAVNELADIFQSSREATARRLVEMNLWPCALAVWHLAHKNSEAHINQQLTLGGPEWTLPEKKLRIRYAVSSSLFGHYLYRNLAAPQNGCLMRCFRKGGVVCDEEHIALKNKVITFYVMATTRNYTDESGATRDVFSLLLSDNTTPRTQGNQQESWTLMEE